MAPTRPEGQANVLLSRDSLVSFASDLSSQERRDILDCLHYSQLRADEKRDRRQSWVSWIRLYQAGLYNNGFTLSGALEHKILSIHDPRDLHAVVRDAIQGTGHQALSVLADSALKALLRSPHAQAFFQDWFSDGQSESMQVVPCCADENGLIDVMICGIRIQTEGAVRSSFSRPTARMTITINGGAFRYSAQAYDPYRNKILQGLERYALTYFDSVP
ncbi:hypothetical protein NJC40_24685 [Pseudomonas sp. 21LCFQ02]|uniref:hypothetical protein n=1 Tax=Pseudomonas sp. 21LCFQ02 TaxID=2957505 RepID=UPI00209AED0D|nr:hypothetical protein [Pseudomonas sp. 21LCFQ02]MCO8170968.1 hypothetical protein [Pseudomonas sp. 21LCFQ02]